MGHRGHRGRRGGGSMPCPQNFSAQPLRKIQKKGKRERKKEIKRERSRGGNGRKAEGRSRRSGWITQTRGRTARDLEADGAKLHGQRRLPTTIVFSPSSTVSALGPERLVPTNAILPEILFGNGNPIVIQCVIHRYQLRPSFKFHN